MAKTLVLVGKLLLVGQAILLPSIHCYQALRLVEPQGVIYSRLGIHDHDLVAVLQIQYVL